VVRARASENRAKSKKVLLLSRTSPLELLRFAETVKRVKGSVGPLYNLRNSEGSQ